MISLIGAFSSSPPGASRNDDDAADRLNYRWTTIILVVFAVLVTTSSLVGDKVQCWAPAHFSDNWEGYTNHYCWVRNTYYLPMEANIPKKHEYEKRHEITYYQWMPMILLLQALFFYFPIFLWRNINARSGLDLNAIIETAETFQVTEKAEDREKNLLGMTIQMDRYLRSMNRRDADCTMSLKSIMASTCCRTCGRRHGNYLIYMYLLVKIVFILNVIFQLYALNAFLGQEFSVYGVDVIRAWTRDEEWAGSRRFPRVTMCDFEIRRLGNIHRYTVQCVLPINLFNEKVYLFVWFWMVIVAAATCMSLVRWTLRAMFYRDRRVYVKKHLQLSGKPFDASKKQFTRFVDDYLMQDGVFVLRLLGHNTNTMAVTDFVGSLWDKYNEQTGKKLDDAEAEV